MKHTKKTLISALLVLMLMPLAQAGFVTQSTAQNDLQVNVDVADALTLSVESLRNFTIDNTAPVSVFVTLAANAGESRWLDDAAYSIDLFMSVDAGVTFTQVGTDVQTTDPSLNTTMTSADMGVFKAVLKFPATRAVGMVPASFVVTIDEAGAPGGNGGALNPSLRHDVRIHFYDATTDSDADGLPDAWEMDNFGHLDYNGGDDPDGDNYTNAQEHAAGSDPKNSASIPESSVAGNGNVSDRELGLAVTGLVMFALIAFIGILFAVDKSRKALDERKVAIIVGGVAASLFAAFSVVAILDMVQLGSAGWAFWAYMRVDWQEWVVFMLGLFITLVGGAVALMMTPQRQEKTVVAQTIVAAVAITAISVVLFVIFGLPVPFIG